MSIRLLENYELCIKEFNALNDDRLFEREKEGGVYADKDRIFNAFVTVIRKLDTLIDQAKKVRLNSLQAYYGDIEMTYNMMIAVIDGAIACVVSHKGKITANELEMVDLIISLRNSFKQARHLKLPKLELVKNNK